jgi:hypothetical protein
MYGRPIRELRFVQIGYIVVAVLTVVVSIYVDSRGGGIYPERSLERTAPGKSIGLIYSPASKERRFPAHRRLRGGVRHKRGEAIRN